MAKVPVVTGISPIEGVPGTKVTIRGENLGSFQDDLIGLLICGVDCLMSAEWKSNNKIIARSGGGVGRGDIIVTTANGGRGSSTVQFKGIQEAMGPLKESAVWVDETIFFNMSFGRKRPLSPSAVLQEDPLGLSTEGNERKELEEDLEDMFPGQSGDISAVNFSCEWFLLENHLSTSYQDICAGLKHLQRKVSSQKEGEIAFLKANVGSVLEQVNSLHELKCLFESDIQQYGRQSTDVLEKAICSCKEEANKLFEDVLHRKDRADSTRNAINVLKRFHFLFYLPVHTEKNIQKGDYDVVINDYARAKSLFGDTQVQIFRRFYNEVENKIENLRRILSEQLVKMPTTLDFQKKIIRNLFHLETAGDPAWQCLGAQHSYILRLLMESRDTYLNREMVDQDHGGAKGPSSALGPGTPRNATPAAKYNKIMMSSVGEWQASAPFRILLVEELCEVLSGNFPDMWKLSQAYFGGELLPSAANVDHSKHPECKEMILELLGAFSGIIRGAIIPQTLNPQGFYIKKYHVWPEPHPYEITPWLPQVLRHIRGCYNTLLMLDLPNDALDVIKTLLFDLRIHCLTSLFQQTVDHLCNLHTRENWKLEVDDEEGGYTQLPQICETDIIECAQLVKETVLEGGRREPSLLDHPSVSTDVGTLIHNVIVAFAQALRRLTLKDPDDVDNETEESRSVDRDGVEGGTSTDPAVPGVELQVLITLSNCAYMQRVILPRLTDSLIRAGYPKEEVNEAVERATQTYHELRETLFDAYLEERIDPVVGMIERSMYIGHFDWSKVRHPPADVRSYVKEILVNVSQVHAEVVGVWPGLVQSLITRVVEVVAEEMARLITCVSSFSPNGALQAHIDLAALNLAFNNYLSTTASSSFQDAIDALPKLSSDAKRTKETALKAFHNKLRFLLACFIDMDPIPESNLQSLSLV